MRRITLAFIMCLCAFTASFGQSKQESIKELFRVMQTDSMVIKMTSSMLAPMQKQMQAQLKDAASQAKFNKKMSSMMAVVQKIIDEDMVELYGKYFSQEEIDEFIRFYKTPAGQKYIKVSPELTKELMMIMMQKYTREIQKAMAEDPKDKK